MWQSDHAYLLGSCLLKRPFSSRNPPFSQEPTCSTQWGCRRCPNWLPAISVPSLWTCLNGRTSSIPVLT